MDFEARLLCLGKVGCAKAGLAAHPREIHPSDRYHTIHHPPCVVFSVLESRRALFSIFDFLDLVLIGATESFKHHSTRCFYIETFSTHDSRHYTEAYVIQDASHAIILASKISKPQHSPVFFFGSFAPGGTLWAGSVRSFRFFLPESFPG